MKTKLFFISRISFFALAKIINMMKANLTSTYFYYAGKISNISTISFKKFKFILAVASFVLLDLFFYL